MATTMGPVSGPSSTGLLTPGPSFSGLEYRGGGSTNRAGSQCTVAELSTRTPNTQRYTKGEVLGRGACKIVYKAFDEEEGLEVAWNEVTVSGEFATVQEKERERIFGEIRLLQQLKHKNILALHDWWFDRKNSNIVFITELLDGSLRTYRRKHKNVDSAVLKRWAWQILQGLVYLHGHNPPIIHRDLKSDNILMNGASGTLKIGDLGFATFRAGFSGAMSVIGTPEFMAPELYEEKYDEKVDIYSFGLCLLELATLEYPYCECRNAAQIFKKVTKGIEPEGIARIQDNELKEFVLLCIRHDPTQRPEARQLLKHKFFEAMRAEGARKPQPQQVHSAAHLSNAGSGALLIHIPSHGLPVGGPLPLPPAAQPPTRISSDGNLCGFGTGGPGPGPAPATSATLQAAAQALGFARASAPGHAGLDTATPGQENSDTWAQGLMATFSAPPGGDAAGSPQQQLMALRIAAALQSNGGVGGSDDMTSYAAVAAGCGRPPLPRTSAGGGAPPGSEGVPEARRSISATGRVGESSGGGDAGADNLAASRSVSRSITAPQLSVEASRNDEQGAGEEEDEDDVLFYTPHGDEHAQAGLSPQENGSLAQTPSPAAYVARPPPSPFLGQGQWSPSARLSLQRSRDCCAIQEDDSDDENHEVAGAEGLGARVRLNCRNHEDNMLAFSMSFVNHHGTRNKVGFQYDMAADTATEVAGEMIENLSLNTAEAGFIASLIQKEIARYHNLPGSGTLAVAAPAALPLPPPPAPVVPRRTSLPGAQSSPGQQQQGWLQQELSVGVSSGGMGATAPVPVPAVTPPPKSALTQGLAMSAGSRAGSSTHLPSAANLPQPPNSHPPGQQMQELHIQGPGQIQGLGQIQGSGQIIQGSNQIQGPGAPPMYVGFPPGPMHYALHGTGGHAVDVLGQMQSMWQQQQYPLHGHHRGGPGPDMEDHPEEDEDEGEQREEPSCFF